LAAVLINVRLAPLSSSPLIYDSPRYPDGHHAF
jgi:hypothetical protein